MCMNYLYQYPPICKTTWGVIVDHFFFWSVCMCVERMFLQTLLLFSHIKTGFQMLKVLRQNINGHFLTLTRQLVWMQSRPKWTAYVWTKLQFLKFYCNLCSFINLYTATPCFVSPKSSNNCIWNTYGETEVDACYNFVFFLLNKCNPLLKVCKNCY